MPLTREQKQKIVEELKEKLVEQKAMLFFDHSHLKAKDLFSLRKLLKKEKNLFRVVKKTLFGLALKNKHPELAKKMKTMGGQLSVIFCLSDGISPAKLLYRFSRENPDLKILGGFFEEKFQEPETIMTLAQLPSRQELLASLTGSIFSPVSGLIYCLKANLRNLVYVLSQINPEVKESSG